MKILMVLMGLDTGGAETHVVELSRALKERGHEICVASAGGVYVGTLAEAGIGHVTLPLKRKDPISTVVSFFGLRKLIKRGVDVVHCHARIPAFVTSLIYRNARFCRKYPFRFVTTAHWVFKVTPLLRMWTVWGERCIAVSADIADYLTDEYRYPPDRISVTVNGIDTDRFSPRGEPDGGVPAVCNVSRLDGSRSRCAEELIRAVAILDGEGVAVRAEIVGGGEKEDMLRAVADRLNAKLNRTAVVLTGAVTDVEKHIEKCRVFCGVSRAALEAMSCGKQVILAGNEGYLGIFGEGNRERAETSNFCCRSGECTAELLAEDIRRALEMPACSESNRKYIIENYSKERMAEDCLGVYRGVVGGRSGKGAVVAGYYGYGNAGDEAILRAVAENVGRPLTVLSAKPLSTRYSCACDAVNRFDPFAVSRAMKRSSLLIFGGGSLLQNKTSTKSLLYYLSLISRAKRLGCAVMIYGNGIGPVYGDKNIRKVRDALISADAVTLRDAETVEKAVRIGVPREKLKTSYDPAVLLGPAPRELERHAVERFAPEGKYVTVALRRLKKRAASDVLCKAFAKVYETTGLGVAVTAMDKRRDAAVCASLTKKLSRFIPKEKLRLVSGISYSEASAVIAGSEAVYSMRLHALIFAVCRGVPCVGVSHDEKITDYLKYADGYCASVPPYADGDEIAAAVVSAVSAGRRVPDLGRARGLALDDAATATQIAATGYGGDGK